MTQALILGGWIFWTVVASLISTVLFTIAVGLVRAFSLHRFLFRVRRAVDKGWCPFKRWRIWPREYLKDAYRMAGFPGISHGVSYHFSRPDGPISAHWHGIGDWKIGTSHS